MAGGQTARISPERLALLSLALSLALGGAAAGLAWGILAGDARYSSAGQEVVVSIPDIVTVLWTYGILGVLFLVRRPRRGWFPETEFRRVVACCSVILVGASLLDAAEAVSLLLLGSDPLPPSLILGVLVLLGMVMMVLAMAFVIHVDVLERGSKAPGPAAGT